MIHNNRVEFSLVSELCPFKEFELTYFLLIKTIVFCFFNLTYDMMTGKNFIFK
ncbi:hypothetical protein O3M35_000993 [Rhynocoris fuscipes]|uniref:Uncharacterized protein n=1 Tax=Rhynocoris fuscipes TaxID=488301 RepID=A0AAW1DPN4_9HEMI